MEGFGDRVFWHSATRSEFSSDFSWTACVGRSSLDVTGWGVGDDGKSGEGETVDVEVDVDERLEEASIIAMCMGKYTRYRDFI